MTLYNQLKDLEQKHRVRGNIDIANRLKKMIDEMPVKIGVLPVDEKEE